MEYFDDNFFTDINHGTSQEFACVLPQHQCILRPKITRNNIVLSGLIQSNGKTQENPF